MRSWMAEVRVFAVVVRIAQVSSLPPLESLHGSRIPANPNRSP